MLYEVITTALQLRPVTVLKLLDRLDVWRRPQRLEQVLLCCQADFHGRLGFANREYIQPDYIRQSYEAAVAVQVKPIRNNFV